MKHAGLEPWKRLVQIGKLNEQIAEKYYQRNMLRTALEGWFEFTANAKEDKRVMCENFYQRMVKRRCFYAWTKVGNDTIKYLYLSV